MSRLASQVRIAKICPVCVKEGLVPHRMFFFSEEEASRWSCPDHGRAEVQKNRSYVKPAV